MWVAVGSGSCRAPGPCLAKGESAVGTVLLLPGISNVTAELEPFAKMVREDRPELAVSVRRWGRPLRPFRNLFSEKANREHAAAVAAEIAEYKRAHPDQVVYVLGYSGGGAMAAFIAEALPEDIQVDRLILMAPAISKSYPFVERVMPKVREFVAVYTSRRDAIVAAGTMVFGTMDRKAEVSAGSKGFDAEHPRMVHIPWTREAMRALHLGVHSSYMSSAWQRKYLLPAFAVSASVETLKAEPAGN